MLNLTQILSFEISRDCNLSERHKNVCPINKIKRGNRTLTDDAIIIAVVEAHENGFTGMVAFHFYNEPMLHHVRMFALMDRIRKVVPQCRFLLWTNGTILIKDPHLKMFERTYISNYFHVPYETLELFFNGVMCDGKGEAGMDKRLEQGMKEDIRPCRMPFHDMQIDNGGDMHLCCHDWDGDIKIGNIFDEDLKTLADKRYEIVKSIQNGITDCSPDKCLYCKEKLPFVCEYDKEIAARTNLEINK